MIIGSHPTLAFALHFFGGAAIQAVVGLSCFKHNATTVVWAAICGLLVACVDRFGFTIFDGRGLEMPVIIAFVTMSMTWKVLTRFVDL